jgi:hypothetical protein
MRPHFRPPPVVQKRVGDESDESDESDDTEIWSLGTKSIFENLLFILLFFEYLKNV